MACFCKFQCCMKVWELEKWCLLHVTCFPPMHVRNSVVDELLYKEEG